MRRVTAGEAGQDPTLASRQAAGGRIQHDREGTQKQKRSKRDRESKKESEKG